LEHQSKTAGLKGKRKMDNVRFSTKRRCAVPAFKLNCHPDSTPIQRGLTPPTFPRTLAAAMRAGFHLQLISARQADAR
jgi:hypothetical protein